MTGSPLRIIINILSEFLKSSSLKTSVSSGETDNIGKLIGNQLTIECSKGSSLNKCLLK